MATIKLGAKQVTEQYLGPMFANLDLVEYPKTTSDGLLLRARGWWRRRFDADGTVEYDDVIPSAEIADSAPLYRLTVTDRANEYRFTFRVPTAAEALAEGFTEPYNVAQLETWTDSLAP